MENHDVEISPGILSRLGGVLYLVIIILGASEEIFVRSRIIVSGDASATAANLRSLESLWRFGIAAEVILLICAIALTMILFILLRPVSRDVALLAVFFNLVSIAVEAVAALGLVAALFPLSDGFLGSFEPAQLDAITRLAIRLHGHGFGFALLFFGCACLLLGYLIYRSGYLPKTLGALILIAGVSYLTNSFALILAPSVAARMFPAILIPAFIGEMSLCLWLLVRGVDIDKWTARASAQAASVTP